jgi:RNA polymerase sigma-70 factor, ECF subfamily
MAEEISVEVTRLLQDVNAGRAGATDALASAVHEHLRAMARRHLRRDFGADLAGITIQPTVLADDTLMKLIKQRQQLDNKGHLFAIASRIMMRLLMDYHRERKAAKRGAGAVKVSIEPGMEPAARGADDMDVEALDAVLEKLAQLDARKAEVVKYRVLWGLTMPEIADALGVGLATAERDWTFAKVWLARELKSPG